MDAILTALLVTCLLFILYRGIKQNKAAFSKVAMSQSLMTLGILALILIICVGFVVLALR